MYESFVMFITAYVGPKSLNDKDCSAASVSALSRVSVANGNVEK